MQHTSVRGWRAAIKMVWVCCALLSLGILRGDAQMPFTFRAWTTHQGLPENQVTCLTQTRDGYLWVGTDDGLARFDGVRFVNFGLADGLRSTRIRTLYEDREGSLWIGTIAGGLSRLQNGRIENFGTESGLTETSINQIAEDDSGRVCVAGRGLAFWQEGRFIKVELPRELSETSFIGMIKSRSGGFWLASYQRGLWRFQDGKFSRETGPDLPAEVNGTCHRIWEDRAGRLWACAGQDKLFCRETNGWQEFSIPLDTALPLLRSLAEEADGTMWAGSIRNGLYFVENGRLTRITTQDGLSENGVESLLVDREGNIWVGTIGGGLNRLTRKEVQSFGPAEGLRYPVVRGLAEVAPGKLWVGTRGDGLYEWENGRFQKKQFEGELASEVFFNSLLRAEDGSCWAATGHGIYRFVNGHPESHPERLRIFENTANVTLCEDPKGGMWAGASTTLWHLSNGEIRPQTNIAPTRAIICITHDRGGAVWVGTEGDGLYCIASNTVRHFTKTDGLGSDQVRVLRFDPGGTLWIGTASGGLTRLKDGRFFTVNRQHGLPDDTVSQILEGSPGYLWVGGNRGIARVSKNEIERLSTGQIQALFPTVLTTADGLPSEECTGTYSPAGLKLSSGELCFATLKGIVMINPNQDWQASPPPDVWLEEVLIDGVAWEQSPAVSTVGGQPVPPEGRIHGTGQKREPLIVNPGRHRFEFHYTGLNFTSPNQVRFRYKMEGLDTDWVAAGSERTADYNYIPPGTYRFRVIACNKDGVWNETGATLGLTVQPFFWQRPWFSVAAFLLALGLAAGAIRSVERSRQNRERERLATQHAIERERTRIAKDIHDDLGATLSEIRLLSTFAQNPGSPAERVREDVKQIAAKALGSTQSLDEIVWAVDPQADSLESFVNYACAFATEYLTLADVRCRLDLPAEIPHHTLRAEVRYNLFLAFKECLTNIVKHAEASEVHIKMESPETTLTVTVTDNGKGLTTETNPIAIKPELSGHDGLANMRSRLADIGGQCKIERAPVHGTTVRLQIPLLDAGHE